MFRTIWFSFILLTLWRNMKQQYFIQQHTLSPMTMYNNLRTRSLERLFRCLDLTDRWQRLNDYRSFLILRQKAIMIPRNVEVFSHKYKNRQRMTNTIGPSEQIHFALQWRKTCHGFSSSSSTLGLWLCAAQGLCSSGTSPIRYI